MSREPQAPHRRRLPRPPAWLPRLTVRGWAFLGCGVVAFVVMELLQRRELAFVGILLVALPILGAVGASLYRLSITVERRFTPELAAAGSEVRVTLIVRNWSWFAGPAVSWFDSAATPLRPSAPAPFGRLPGFRTSVAEVPTPAQLGYELVATHRGRHAIGPLVLLITDPFGMAVARTTVGGTDELIVTPSTVALPQGAVRLASGSGSAHQSRRLGAGGEHDVISRKYQTGDSMRRVNWSATARFGELMVRQDDQQNDQHAVVVLDCGRASYGAAEPHGAESRDDGARGTTAASSPAGRAAAPFSTEFEWAVSMAASIALHLLGEGFHVRMLDQQPSGGTTFEPDAGSDESLLLHAAKIEMLDASTSDVRTALSHIDQASGDLPPLFAVVGRLDDAAAAALAAAARFSSGAVAIIVVPAGDARLPGWAAGLRDTLEAGGWIAQCVGSDEPPSAVWGSLDGERLVL